MSSASYLRNTHALALNHAAELDALATLVLGDGDDDGGERLGRSAHHDVVEFAPHALKSVDVRVGRGVREVEEDERVGILRVGAPGQGRLGLGHPRKDALKGLRRKTQSLSRRSSCARAGARRPTQGLSSAWSRNRDIRRGSGRRGDAADGGERARDATRTRRRGRRSADIRASKRGEARRAAHVRSIRRLDVAGCASLFRHGRVVVVPSR